MTRTKRSPTSETGAGDSTPPVQSAAAPFLARGYPGHAGAADGRRCRLRLCLHADWALGLARLLAGRPSNCTTTRRKCVPTLLTDLNSKSHNSTLFVMGTVDVRKWDLVADHHVTYIDMRERERESVPQSY